MIAWSARRRVTPTILQIEAVECGAASLAMILAHYGRWAPLIELRRLCGVSRDGSKASNIVRAARNYGLTAGGTRVDAAGVASQPMPAIAFVNFNHFVVVEGFARSQVFINDPAVGRLVLTPEEFERIFSGVILTFAPNEGFAPGGRPPRTIGPLMARLAGLTSSAGVIIAAGILLAFPGIVVPGLSRVFVDEVVVGGQRDWGIWIVWSIIAATALQLGLAFVEKQAGLTLRARISIDAATRFFHRLLRLPVTFFQQRSPGGLSSRVDMADKLAAHAGVDLTSIAINAATMALVAAVLTLYSPPLAAVTLGAGACAIGLFLILQRRIAASERKATLDTVKLSGRTMQGLSMIETLKVSATEDAFFETWSGQQAVVASQRQKGGRLEALLATVPDFLTQSSTVVVVVLAGVLAIRGALTLGTLVAFLALQTAFFVPMKATLLSLLSLAKSRATLDQFDDVADEAMAPEFRRAAGEAEAGRGASALGRIRKLDGHLAIDGLTFGYAALEPPLLSDFSLTLRPGSRVALIGGSGSGKSTVGRLVSGLFQPWSGTIRLDGEPMGSIPRDLVRNSMAVVDQDIVMFAGTVRDNIALWDSAMPEERIVRAAKDAMIHDDIVQRPGGYAGAVVEGGRNFSGGQRQRLEIARALVTNPSILILDEATSALDPVVEKAVMDNIRRRGCTCVIIAHRLSTIRDCDEIIVMHRGRILERGTHAQMAAVDGPYRKLIET